MNQRFIQILTAITAFSIIFFLAGCQKDNSNESIPSYIHIDKIDVIDNANINEGSLSSNITDAWIYVDNELIGAFELPATVPVLAAGEVNIKIKAGVKMNGISTTRIPYPFYKEYSTKVNLAREQITTITPRVKYLDNIVIPWREDFEDPSLSIDNGSKSDTIILLEEEMPFEGSHSGRVVLEGDKLFFEMTSDTTYALPQTGDAIFLELDFKTNSTITTGMYINAGTLVQQNAIVMLNPTEEWKKIYINLTKTVLNTINPRNFRIFFGILRSENSETTEAYFDNIKLIY